MAMGADADITEKLLPSSPEVSLKGMNGKGAAAVAGRSPPLQMRRLQLAALLVALSSFLWGYGVSVLNVCIVPDAVGSLLAEINLSTHEQETATALVLIGAVFTALTTGGIGDRVGLKKTLLVNNLLFIAGAIACALATSKKAIFVGRFLIGMACGIVTSTAPILLNEISPVHCRGQITAFHQLLLTIGMLATGILGAIVVTNVPSGWRYVNAFMIVPAGLQCLLVAFVPESPWWLMKHHGREQSKAVLKSLRPGWPAAAIDAELREIADAMEHRRHDKVVHWSDLWAHRTEVTIGALLVFFQAMTGINTVMLYSAKIFHFAGVTNPFVATVLVGLVNVSVTIFSVSLVDSYGRRPLLMSGIAAMIVALVVLSLSLLYLDANLRLQGLIAVGAVLMFVAGFASSLGVVVWVMLGDITPVHIRSRAFSLFMGLSYLCNILIAVYTLSAITFLGRGPTPEKNGIAKLYLILSGVAFASLSFVYGFVPETRVAAAHGEEHDSLLFDHEDVPTETTEL